MINRVTCLSARRGVLAAALAAALVGSAARGQTLKQGADVGPLIHMFQSLIVEMKTLCTARYPDLSSDIEAAYDAWPLSRGRVKVPVDGTNSATQLTNQLVVSTRSDFARSDDARARKDCENFRLGLNNLARDFPPELLTPYLVK